MNNIQEKIKEIINRVIAWWKRFTTKQKILLGGLVSAVVIALVILAMVMTKPTYLTLVIADSTKEAASIKEILDSDSSIDYKIMDDDLTFKVNKKSETAAKYLLGTNKIKSEDYTIDDVVDGSFSQTEADKTKKYQIFLEKQLEEDLSAMENIESAKVNLSIPVDDGTILSRNEFTYASVALSLKKDLADGQAEGLAKFIATAVGDDSTEPITILDSEANVLFAGGDENSDAGVTSKQQGLEKSKENSMKNNIRSVLLGTNAYDNVEIGLKLVMDFTNKKTKDTQYSVADGRDEGYITSESNYENETKGGTSGIPGVSSNDSDTPSYVVDPNGTSSSTTTDSSINRALNKTETETIDRGGTVNYDDSKVAVTAITYKYYNEDALKKAGELKDKTFDEYVAEHSERTQLEVPEEYVALVADASGISEANIQMMAFEVPYFEYSSGSGRTVADYIEIALAVLIFALLGYVVFRSTRPDKVEEEEPELSVESLLESTKLEEKLEDIGYTEKSETRILIEKFVDEKPEAAASLLRNWLEEEWE
ncbi:flagellar M-ring protein FliF [Lachnospiraceae bacterium XBB1006]|nr:flagellar M-ring protein FliF [Lachnospiraceae bacterium XBB1006]